MIPVHEAAKEFRALRRKCGSRFAADSVFCASVVKDCLSPMFPIEAPLLAEAATRGVVDEIGKVKKGRRVQIDLARIASEFARDTGHDTTMSSWAVSSWAVALGVVKSSLSGRSPYFPESTQPIPAVAPPHPSRQAPPTSACPAKCMGRGLARLFFVGIVAWVIVLGAREGWWRELLNLIDVQKNKFSHPVGQSQTQQAPMSNERQVQRDLSHPKTQVVPSPKDSSAALVPASRQGSASTTPWSDLSSLSITVVGNAISLNGQHIGRSQLQGLLERAAQEDNNRSIEIMYDESQETGQLKELKEMCRQAGLRRLWVKAVDVR